MKQPDSRQPVYHVRLMPRDRMLAAKLAREMGLPLSTWIRMVILERLAKERSDGK